MSDRPFDLPEPEILAQAVQPEAAIAFWAWKTGMSYDAVQKLDAGARERAFFIAGLAERDAIQGVKDALAEALASGGTFRDFQADIADIIEAQGWRGDRIETIFRNNLQTAYSAGRYAKMQEVKEARPYWQYITVGDERVRPTHAILSDRVFPADHDFWIENYPPNGHRCRCGVRTLSARQVEKEGLTVETAMPGPGVYTDPKNGMEYHVARCGADNGWADNPGKTWFEDGATSGLPLHEHKDLTPEAYDDQRLRPAPVKDYAGLAQGIEDRAKPFLRNSTGVTGVELNRKSYFMATDSRGRFYLSSKAYNDPKMGKFTPALHLKEAWNKIATGKAMTWHEEYAVEMLWHEIVHNRQKLAFVGGKNSLTRRTMEIVTQWTARRTYPDFLKALGAVPSHLASIKTDGLGYGSYITRFDRLLSVLKIDESAMLKEMQRLIDNVGRDSYLADLVDFLAGQSGHKKAVIRKAIDKTDAYNYEEVLRVLGLAE